MSNLPLLDEAIYDVIKQSEEKIENILGTDLFFYFGEIRVGFVQPFRNFVEKLKQNSTKDSISICLKTPGGSAEAVERMVDILRYHYKHVFFIVPDMAMSAGTIFCMSGDKIYMDYSASLGPIDPQVPDRDDRYLVPALGYLDKIEELIDKSRNNTITAAEFAILQKQDLAMLRSYEQAKELSIELLKKWLTTYKFKDWDNHRTHNIGQPVTPEEKEKRAQEIAEKLSSNKYWHSHGRFINMKTLQDDLKLEIDDFGQSADLKAAIRSYHDALSTYLARQSITFHIYNRNVS